MPPARVGHREGGRWRWGQPGFSRFLGNHCSLSVTSPGGWGQAGLRRDPRKLLRSVGIPTSRLPSVPVTDTPTPP